MEEPRTKKVIKSKNGDESTSSSSTFAFLVADLARVDIAKTYEMLLSKIKLGKDRLDPDVLSEAVDEAPEWAFKAAQLYIIAKDKLAKFEDVTFKLKYAEFADEANAELEQLKAKKKISGQITKEKVENWILLNKPEYKRMLDELSELKMAVEAFKSLSSQFESKKSLLQTQGRLAEKKGNKFIISKGNDEDDDD